MNLTSNEMISWTWHQMKWFYELDIQRWNDFMKFTFKQWKHNNLRIPSVELDAQGNCVGVYYTNKVIGKERFVFHVIPKLFNSYNHRE